MHGDSPTTYSSSARRCGSALVTCRSASGLPTVLHEPYWAPPDFDGTRQNTDPWVFGDGFRYSNCKQHTNNTPARQPSALQRLPAGSMILFGSAVSGGFVIDTVFVVGGKVGVFRPFDDMSHLGVDPAFEACTLQALTTYEPHIGASTYTLYRGATFDEPVHGMFSFVPCRVHGEPGMRFPRPAIDLPGIINPASKQSHSGATPDGRRPSATSSTPGTRSPTRSSPPGSTSESSSTPRHGDSWPPE
jgi:hypothetical protein